MQAEKTSLEDIRKEIDAIDDGILDLLARRIRAQKKVRAQKTSAGALTASPIRPSREALILRRLIARSDGVVPPELLVRLWRTILSASTLSQANVTIHVPASVASSRKLHRLLSEHFGPMPVSEHATTAEALRAIGETPSDVAVVETQSGWAGDFENNASGDARVIAALPLLKGRGIPELLVFGHAPTEETGNDCTLLLVKDAKAGIADALWRAHSGNSALACLRGFQPALPEGAIVAGRFADQIEGDR